MCIVVIVVHATNSTFQTEEAATPSNVEAATEPTTEAEVPTAAVVPESGSAADDVSTAPLPLSIQAENSV